MKFEHKHRPHSLADIIFADAHVAGVIQDTASGVRDNHIILHGPRGSGKSETARLLQLARLGCEAQGVFADPIHAKTYEHESFDPILTTWNQIPRQAIASCQKPLGVSGDGKLRLSVTARGSAPTQLRLRAASATAA